jgi:hypothetical protein
MNGMIRTCHWASTLVVLLAAGSFAAAQAPPPPSVTVELGFDDYNLQSALTWYSEVSEPWPSIAVRASSQAIVGSPYTTGEGTWMLVIGSVFMDDPDHCLDPERANDLIEQHPWLALAKRDLKSAFEDERLFLSAIAHRFYPEHIDELSGLELHVAPDDLAALLQAAFLNGGEDVRLWGQPFLRSAPSGPLQTSVVWRIWCDYWVPGVSNWLWASTFSRAKDPADFATGQHMLSVNRLAESIIAYKSGGMAFLQSAEYYEALNLGLTVAMHVVTLRAPGVPPSFLSTTSPFTTPAIGDDLVGISVSEKFIIRPVLRKPAFGPSVYEVNVATPWPLTAGSGALIALGQSSTMDTAIFGRQGGGTVSAPLTLLQPTAGIVSLLVPVDAIASEVTFAEWGAAPPPSWKTRVMPASWHGNGMPVENDY